MTISTRDMSRRQALAIALGATIAPIPFAKAEDTWPTKPVRLIVGSAAGPTDVQARILADKLGERLGQRVLVENRAGALGNIAMQATAKSPADGYTFVFVIASMISTNPFIYKTLLYDIDKEFEPIAMLSKAGFAYLARPDLGVRTMKELAELIKANPGKIKAANVAPGSLGHLSFESYLRSFDGKVNMVAYRTTTQSLQDLWGGRVDVYPAPIGSTKQAIADGKAIVLAISTAERHPSLPDVPTVAEQGYADFDFYGWYGVMAPKGTPAKIIERANKEIMAIAASEDYRERMIAMGAVPSPPGTPADFEAIYKREQKVYEPLIKSMDIKIE